tara:strand:- start:3423 stop:3662 length:240 start_codon:yes stop_codon:yes gene_type:complete
MSDISIDAVQPIGSIHPKLETGYSHQEQTETGTNHIYTNVIETETGKVIGEQDTIVQIYDRFGNLYAPPVVGGLVDSSV